MEKDELDRIQPPKMTNKALLEALNRAWSSYTEASTHGTRSAAQHAFHNARRQLNVRNVAIRQDGQTWKFVHAEEVKRES